MTHSEEKGFSHLSAGKGFVQFKAEFLFPHWAQLADCPAAVRLIFWLLSHANKTNWITSDQQRLMKGTKLSRKSLYRALTFLEERKFIVREGKGIILNELMTWRNYEPVNPHLARAMAQPMITAKTRDRPKRVKRVAA